MTDATVIEPLTAAQIARAEIAAKFPHITTSDAVIEITKHDDHTEYTITGTYEDVEQAIKDIRAPHGLSAWEVTLPVKGSNDQWRAKGFRLHRGEA